MARFTKNCKVEAFIGGCWKAGRYIGRETGEMDVQTFSEGVVRTRTVKYDRRYVDLGGGVWCAVSKENLRRV